MQAQKGPWVWEYAPLSTNFAEGESKFAAAIIPNKLVTQFKNWWNKYSITKIRIKLNLVYNVFNATFITVTKLRGEE